MAYAAIIGKTRLTLTFRLGNILCSHPPKTVDARTFWNSGMINSRNGYVLDTYLVDQTLRNY